jgi:hemoglobin-like flavoprotein
MPTDAELIEASLVAAADANINTPLYARFFAAYPERAPTFTNLEASAPRMTDETLQMIHGLATNESWVWPLIAELTFTHRNYGSIPHSEYEAFITMTINTLAEAVGAAWDAETDAAWRRQGDALYAKIVEAREGWATAMPGGPALVS